MAESSVPRWSPPTYRGLTEQWQPRATAPQDGTLIFVWDSANPTDTPLVRWQRVGEVEGWQDLDGHFHGVTPDAQWRALTTEEWSDER